eukprot:TRINITY_DN19874_c0_g1_i2.p1 TRINITY_DN19874_c0_g1~~TRINITY_DN19874_c0_g1_i2.p1  ORF type:complete len:130 (+),score=19.35 TRINITY_DN19874_c0_g1_i2:77-466(+)
MVSALQLLITICVCSAVQVTISNANPRLDVKGNIMDIHDGNTLLLSDGYYYYGASYGLCQEPSGDSGCSGAALGSCGFQADHNVSLYTSTDLTTWYFQGHVFEMGTQSPEIGRAVQQECRDRSRMPSSA